MATASNRLIWAALVASLLIYGVVAAVVAPSRATTAASGLHAFTFALAVIALGTAAATIFVRGRLLVLPIERGALDPRTRAGQQRAFVPFLLCLVLSESIGIYGLVLAFLSGDVRLALPFLALALGLMWLHRPTSRRLVPPQSGASAQLDATPIG